MVVQRSRIRVPVEHRFLGLDVRTFPAALIALGVCLALIYGWPAANAAIAWDDPIRAGDVIDLGDGARAVPPVGWQLESGVRTGGGTQPPDGIDVLLSSGSTTIEMRGTAFTGDAGAFLDQVETSQGQSPAAVTGSRGTVTTTAGLVGVSQTSSSPSGEELLVSFKMATGEPKQIDDAPALLVIVRTAPGQYERNRHIIDAFIASIQPGSTR
ncbi:hypothetical protein [Microbacterium sp. 1.5R]|uniref:hypothetical protein n=1 Tax=Microbacterium sp. 1.5R TaxID=1916917 RepID=UPI0011A58F0E|nr:hypothetical protein [Microbacterium sp. 1.5R]